MVASHFLSFYVRNLTMPENLTAFVANYYLG